MKRVSDKRTVQLIMREIVYITSISLKLWRQHWLILSTSVQTKFEKERHERYTVYQPAAEDQDWCRETVRMLKFYPYRKTDYL
jgi:hypothetical protein